MLITGIKMKSILLRNKRATSQKSYKLSPNLILEVEGEEREGVEVKQAEEAIENQAGAKEEEAAEEGVEEAEVEEAEPGAEEGAVAEEGLASRELSLVKITTDMEGEEAACLLELRHC